MPILLGMGLGRRWWLFGWLLVANLLLWGTAGDAAAHPQGNDTVNRYVRVELYRGEAHIHYVVDYAELPTLTWSFNADRDGDGRVDPAEREVELSRLKASIADGLVVTVDGTEVEIEPAGGSLETFEGDAGLDVLRVALAFRVEVAEAAGEVEVAVYDGNYEGRRGWRTFTLLPSDGTAFDADAAVLEDLSAALTLFPEGWVEFPPIERALVFLWQPRSGQVAPGTVTLSTLRPASDSGGFAGLLSRGGSPWLALAGLLLAFGFGLIDALGPGHGKTVVAGFVASTRATARQAVSLGLIAAGTHTVVVLGIAWITMMAASTAVSSDSGPVLRAVAGFLVAGVGLALLAHHLRHRDHDHRPTRSMTGRGVAGVGIAGGLVPCPVSLLVMLGAVANGDTIYGMMLVTAFGMGMAVVLASVGLAVSGAFRLRWSAGSERSGQRLARLAGVLPVASACVMVVAGIAVATV